MKKITYTKEVEEPKLIIEYDTDCESPRQDGNLGYFYTKAIKYESPDGNIGEIYNAMIAGESEAYNTESHIKIMTRLIEENTMEKVLAVYPINRFEHGNIKYSIGMAKGFDYSNCGFYIITDKTVKSVGTKPKDFENVIKAELDMYNAWVNGEIYRFTLLDDKGEQVDSVGGFYNIEDIRNYLPTEEWKDEKLEYYLV